MLRTVTVISSTMGTVISLPFSALLSVLGLMCASVNNFTLTDYKEDLNPLTVSPLHPLHPKRSIQDHRLVFVTSFHIYTAHVERPPSSLCRKSSSDKACFLPARSLNLYSNCHHLMSDRAESPKTEIL